MQIKNFFQFVSEELVFQISPDGKTQSGLSRLKEYDSNVFSKIFNSDPLKVKQFIQSELKLEDLFFIKGGAIGLAFYWKDKVLKFTSDINEADGVKKMIQKTPGDKRIPGFAKYYWIREVSIPESNQIKFSYDSTKEEEDKIKKRRELSKSGKSLYNLQDDYLSSDEISKRKMISKTTKAYIICMERIKVLDYIESEIAHFIFLMIKHKYLVPSENNNFKLESLVDWIKSNEEKYVEKSFLEIGLDKKPIFSTFVTGLSKDSLFSSNPETRNEYLNIWRKISKNHFMDFSTKMLNIYKIGEDMEIPVSDIHENNLGYSGKELVAFDCM